MWFLPDHISIALAEYRCPILSYRRTLNRSDLHLLVLIVPNINSGLNRRFIVLMSTVERADLEAFAWRWRCHSAVAAEEDHNEDGNVQCSAYEPGFDILPALKGEDSRPQLGY